MRSPRLRRKRWQRLGWAACRDEAGVAGIEFAMIMPVLLLLLLGSVDIGNALWLSRKLTTAGQSVADILAREGELDSEMIEDTLDLANLIVQPLADEPLGYDIIGIRFDEDNGAPEVAWRETDGMSEDPRYPEDADGLGDPGEGVIVVVVTTAYEPVFLTDLLGTIPLREVAVFRGRRSPFIPFDDY